MPLLVYTRVNIPYTPTRWSADIYIWQLLICFVNGRAQRPGPNGGTPKLIKTLDRIWVGSQHRPVRLRLGP